MPELKRDALGWAFALDRFADATFSGDNLKHGAGQPGLGSRLMPNHEKSGHSGLLADKESSAPVRSPGREQVVTTVSVRAARRSRDEALPKSSEISRILDKRSKTRDCVGPTRECHRGAEVARTMICMSDFSIARAMLPLA
jgi:hypothetical protein